jgi:hypothetical protein
MMEKIAAYALAMLIWGGLAGLVYSAVTHKPKPPTQEAQARAAEHAHAVTPHALDAREVRQAPRRCRAGRRSISPELASRHSCAIAVPASFSPDSLPQD